MSTITTTIRFTDSLAYVLTGNVAEDDDGRPRLQGALTATTLDGTPVTLTEAEYSDSVYEIEAMAEEAKGPRPRYMTQAEIEAEIAAERVDIEYDKHCEAMRTED